MAGGLKKKESNPLIVLLVVWNEIEWVGKALDQIYSLNPKEILIAEGCFDRRFDLESTDGTFEFLKQVAESRSDVTLHRVIRRGRFQHIWRDLGFLAGMSRAPGWNTIYRFLRRWTLHTYRLNQADTFNQLLKNSKSIVPGDFFMTVDVDEFYGEGVSESLRNLTEMQEFDFLTFHEIVLVDPLGRIAPLHSQQSFRRWNIPIKFTGREFFMFTRGVWRIWEKGRRVQMRSVPDINEPGAYLGEVFHCKYRLSTNRHEVGYSFGDRRAPSADRMRSIAFIPPIPANIPA